MLFACAEDDTTLGGNAISNITIDESSVKPEYNVEKNDEVVISPVVTQTIEGKSLSYIWEVEHEVYSTEPTLRYSCNALGSFNCRLIVENEDGKAFYPFIINVNTPYEEGWVIISKDPAGKSMISFMLHHIDGTPDEFYDGDIFSLNNPEINFSANVSDVLQSNGNLIIACQGDKDASNPPAIYYINEKTMDLENYVEVDDYADFAPKKMFVCSVGTPGSSYPILSSDGKVYDFASTEGTVVTSNKFPSVYDTDAIEFYDLGTGTSFNIFMWDNPVGIPVTMFNGYGAYYCVKDYSQRENLAFINPLTSIFFGEEPFAMFVPRFTKAQLLRDTPQIYIISQNGGKLRKSALGLSIWAYDNDTGKNIFDVRQQLVAIGSTDSSPLRKGAPMVASNTHKRLFFANGNTIYQWYYPDGLISSATPFASVGDASTVIKSIDLSTDQNTLYVAAYNPSQSGLNGSAYFVEVKQTVGTEVVYAGETVAYNNISYEPIKILYKNK